MGLNRFFGLSWEFAKTEFKLKNEGSYLGILWYLINPILLFLLIFLIFHDRLGAKIVNYPAYLFLGIIIFNFFQQTTTESIRVIKSNKWIIKSIKFPQESLIAGITLKNLFSHIFEFIILVIIFILQKVSLYFLILYPIIFLIIMLFTYGISLIISAVSVYISDLENIWLFLVRLIWLGTPIFYEIAGQTKLFYINLINPIYYLITISRIVIINQKMPEIWMIFGVLIYCLLSLIFGIYIFNKLKPKFAELM